MFNYIGQAPWPKPMPQMDWIDQLLVMEHWLNEYIGESNWTWQLPDDTGLARVAFKKETYLTLWLINFT